MSDISLKLCKDCAHLLGNRFYPDNWESWRCAAPVNRDGINPVNGNILYKVEFCATARARQDSCRKEGLWYEEYKAPNLMGLTTITPKAEAKSGRSSLVFKGEIDPKDLGM